MKAQGQRTEQDYVAAQYLYLRPRPAFAITGVLLIGLLIWSMGPSDSIPIFSAIFIVLVYVAFVMPWRHRRIFRQYKALSEPFTLEVREEGLFFEGERGSELIPWSHIVKWRSNRAMVLLYPAGNLFYLVPGHCFSSPDEFAAFVAILKDRLGGAA